jgi:uncharacterized protein (TIGR02145 family)
VPQGTTSGDMLYWDGAKWNVVPAGNQGEMLVLWNNVPNWGGGIVISTTSVSSITAFEASSGGAIASSSSIPVTARGVCWNTTGNPLVDNDHTIDSSGTGSFTSQLSGLLPGTLYHLRAYATNSQGTSYGNEVTFSTSAAPFICGTSSLTDSRDNKSYQTVLVAGKCWMKQNLNIGNRIDGGVTQQNNGTIEKYCYSNDTANCTVYGGLYQWGEMMQYTTTQGVQGICPTGWHLPTKDEWTYLTNALGGEAIAGGKLKESGTSHWLSPNTGATNETGFTALPGGLISGTSSLYLQTNGIWWTSTQANTSGAYYRAMDNNSASVNGLVYQPKSYGLSIRCVNSSGLPPAVYTLGAEAASNVTVNVDYEVSTGADLPVTARGVCWNSTGNPTLTDAHTTDGTGAGSYTTTVTGLTENTLYYIRVYATSLAGTTLGNVEMVTTWPDPLLPTVETTPVEIAASITATGGGNITNGGGSSVTARGVCYNTAGNPTLADSFTINGSGTGSFVTQLTGLSVSTTYYIRAYATNSYGTRYGGTELFETQPAAVPDLITGEVTDILARTALCGGEVTSDNGSPVTARGVCWNETDDPTIADPHTVDGAGLGAFSSQLTVMTPNTSHYVRSYATNGVGTAYGNAVNFYTLITVPPSVTTAPVSSVTRTMAECGGKVTYDGGEAVLARGVYWNTTGDPEIWDENHTLDGSDTGTFISNLIGLRANTTYYVWAYAENITGRSIGNQESFTTALPVLPAITTMMVSSISSSTASAGGNITDDGGSDITSRGVCWNNTGSPTTSDPHTSDGVGPGAFASSLTGLSYYTTYHLRAYATNDAGTAYGNEVTYITLVEDGQPCPGTPLVWCGGKNYYTVQIGSQCWFRENLDIGIKLDSNVSQTDNGIIEKYCYHDLEANCNIYGGFYQWAELVQYVNGATNTETGDPVPAGNIQGICPSGWHIPSDVELTTLTSYLGGTTIAGGKLKETGTTHWQTPNAGATNESGFTAFPAGMNNQFGLYQDIFHATYFWSSAQNDATNAWHRSLSFDTDAAGTSFFDKSNAVSVRCLKN